MQRFGTHDGFVHNRRWWDWASRDDANLWVTGSRPAEEFDRAGWELALKLIEACPDYRDKTLLEWGCGIGRVTRYLAYLFRQVCAVDIAPGMLDHVRGLGLPDTSFHLTGGADLPDGLEVDVVYSYACWFHNLKPDLVPIMRSCRRALRPGGRLLFQLPVYDTPQDPVDFQDIACWTADELTALADATGFEVVTLARSPGTFHHSDVGTRHFDLHEWRPR
jgi:SAM-dependent methyltransferase